MAAQVSLARRDAGRTIAEMRIDRTKMFTVHNIDKSPPPNSSHPSTAIVVAVRRPDFICSSSYIVEHPRQYPPWTTLHLPERPYVCRSAPSRTHLPITHESHENHCGSVLYAAMRHLAWLLLHARNCRPRCIFSSRCSSERMYSNSSRAARPQ